MQHRSQRKTFIISAIQSAVNKLRRMEDDSWKDDDFTYNQGYTTGYHTALTDLEEIFLQPVNESKVLTPSRRFCDERYPGKVITESELRRKYELDDIRFEISFHQWLRNCMSFSGGTLSEIFE